MAFLNKGLIIEFKDERPEREQEITYQYKGGLVDFVKHLNATKDPLFSEGLPVRGRRRRRPDARRRHAVEHRLPRRHPRVRERHLHHRGRHARRGLPLRAHLHDRTSTPARRTSSRRRTPNLTGDDVREGLTAIVSVKLREPQFEGQTKAKLGNVPTRSFVQKATNETPRRMAAGEPGRSEAKLVQKGVAAAQARDAAKNARNAIRRKTALSGAGMPDKLKDCQSKNAEESEIFIVEGDSAGGTAVDARRPYSQAILPIRGKILNVERARIDKMLKNNEIQALITAIGAGVGDEFDVEQGPLPQGDLPGRRRRRRQPHPHAAAHVLLPPDARDGRSRLLLHRTAAAVLDRDRQGEDLPQGRRRQGGRSSRSARTTRRTSPDSRVSARWTGKNCGRPRWTPATRTLLQVTVDEAARGRRDHVDPDGR